MAFPKETWREAFLGDPLGIRGPVIIPCVYVKPLLPGSRHAACCIHGQIAHDDLLGGFSGEAGINQAENSVED